MKEHKQLLNDWFWKEVGFKVLRDWHKVFVRGVYCIMQFILVHEKFLQFDWLRELVFQLNLKYLHVRITNLLWVVV